MTPSMYNLLSSLSLFRFSTGLCASINFPLGSNYEEKALVFAENDMAFGIGLIGFLELAVIKHMTTNGFMGFGVTIIVSIPTPSQPSTISRRLDRSSETINNI
jgi:hypothetical protein